MRQFYCFLCCLLFLLPFAVGQNCLPNGIQFTSQRSIDSFRVNYPGCTIIEGDVEISRFSEINNLQGLKNIRSVEGTLRITGTNQLEGLQGLENLQDIGGSLYLDDNQGFEHLKGLERLKTIGLNLYLDNNQSLKSLNGLDSLTHIGQSLDIRSNDSLQVVSGLPSLEKIMGGIRISGNRVLKEINGFDNIDTLVNIYIVGCHALENVNSFQSLKVVKNEFELRGNSKLTELNTFNQLTQTGRFFIQGNKLNSFENFENLSVIKGNVSFQEDSIINLKGLEQLDSILGNVNISHCGNLESLSGLENLVAVKGYLSIDVLNNLTSLSGLLQLNSIGGGLSLSYCPKLTSLEGLNNLQLLSELLYINHNDSLSDISAISNLNISTISDLRLRENPLLNSCAVNSICHFLETATDELIIIQNNATDCVDRLAVSNECGIDYEPPTPSYKSVEWDWTSHIKRTGQTAQNFPTDIFHDSQNNSYIVGFYESETYFNTELLAYDGRIGRDWHSFIAKYDSEGELIWAKNENIGNRVIAATIDKNDIIHVFVGDSIKSTGTYFYEKYDTDWNQLSTQPIITLEKNVTTFTRHQITLDHKNNPYFII